MFLVARFVMPYLLSSFRLIKVVFIPGALGAMFAFVAVPVPTMIGSMAVVAISLWLYLRFPTIYGVASRGRRHDPKCAAVGLVMAILGRVLLALLRGRVMDVLGAASAYRLPAVCRGLVARYALFDRRTARQDEPLVAGHAAH